MYVKQMKKEEKKKKKRKKKRKKKKKKEKKEEEKKEKKEKKKNLMGLSAFQSVHAIVTLSNRTQMGFYEIMNCQIYGLESVAGSSEVS